MSATHPAVAAAQGPEQGGAQAEVISLWAAGESIARIAAAVGAPTEAIESTLLAFLFDFD